MGSPIVGPIPAYSNVPIQPQNYEPSRFQITAITMGPTTTVTTAADHNYIIGQQVRLLIPETFGARKLNGQSGLVLSIPSSTQVVLDINSVGVDPLVSSPVFTKPQILAIGDTSNGIISSTGRVIPSVGVPGAFINIS